MVQNKQKFNKINITAIITSFMLIMVFVFGCVQYAFASGISEDNVKSELTKRYGLDFSNIYYMTTYYPNGNIRITALNYDINKYDVYAAFSIYDGGCTYTACYKEKDDDVWYGANTFACTMNSKGETWFKGNGDSSLISEVVVYSDCTATSNFPIYDMSGKSGGLDYKNIEKNGFPLANNLSSLSTYDENIPTPKSVEIYFDRKLNKPFNLADLCNPLKIKWTIPESEDYSEYILDVQIDVNYNKLNSISGIGTKPTVLQTGKVEFASCSATDKELNISSTYDGWMKLSEKYQSSVWGLTGNYFDLWLRYKDSSGNYGNWVKVTINPDNSSTVIKAGLFDNGTNTTINKGYEEIRGDNGEHVNGDYDNYYVGTADENISNNLTKLRENYTNLVSFFKELFGFLPAEIWIILIGLVATMALIAILMFVRG